ncbi:MAG: hypothetical protein ABFS86_15675 [Planctomycetota bacterium]
MRRILTICLLLLPFAPAVAQEDVYLEIPIAKIAPGWRDRVWIRDLSRFVSMAPRVVLKGEGEAWVARPQDLVGPDAVATARVHIRLSKPGRVVGLLLLPKEDFSGMTVHPFSAEATGEAVEGAAERFVEARNFRLGKLLEARVTGAAWFRHRLGDVGPDRPRNPRPGRPGEFEDTFAMITGGRALSENLSLDQVMESDPSDDAATVPLDEIEGVTVAPFDWKARLGDRKPALDPLARCIPADQHALFFPSFDAMVKLVDEADAHGTPVLQWLETSAVDAGTRQRYERQLRLELDGLARTFGPKLVKSVAVTGSDLYLRTGTDVAVIFEAKNVALLDATLKEWRAKNGRTPGTGSKARASFQARLGDGAIVVTNSHAQLERLVRTTAGEVPSLATLDEYRCFRAEYPKDEPETAFLMITDETLRRWCSPRWRIAASRRTRAAAILAEMQARLADGNRDPLEAGFDLGDVTIEGDHVHSGLYGTLDSLTPISEMAFDKVTEAERDGYARWKRGYETNWKAYYDPIAARVHLDGDTLDLDLTVLPLQLGSDYEQMITLAGDSKIRPGAGDPHPQSLLHYIFAIDRKSKPMKDLGGMSVGMTGDARLNLLDWIGETVSICLDDGPVIDEFLACDDPEKFVEENWGRIPVGVHVDIANGLKFVGFMTAARAFIAVGAPNMVTFEPQTHRERQYMKVSASEEDITVYYTSYPGGLFVTLSETMIHQHIDRYLDKKALEAQDVEGESKELPPPEPWPGESAAFRGRDRMVAVIEKAAGPFWLRRMQDRAWSNLPIMNEWRRLYPDEDPVEVHHRFFGARPVCPGGQGYRWNEEMKTVESVVYGHPAAPSGPMTLPPAVRRILEAELGLTFFDGGVRARGTVLRKKR